MGLENPPRNASSDWKKRHRETIHHINPLSRGGQDVSINRVPLYEGMHQGLHYLFGNLKINEQIFKLLNMGETAYNKEFMIDILKVLQETDDKYYYKNGVLHKKVFIIKPNEGQK